MPRVPLFALAVPLALAACSVVDIEVDTVEAEARVVEAAIVSSTPGGYGRALRVESVVIAPNACFGPAGFAFVQEEARIVIDALVRAGSDGCADDTPREISLGGSVVARGEGPHTLVFDGVDGPLEVVFEGGESGGRSG